jgi:queuine tRNA-ribosyltransferase
MVTFNFQQLHKDTKSRARTGVIHTPHGDIRTPAFVPVGTQATVKSLTPEELNTLGVQLFFVNTYHAYLRPGIEVIKKAGGLHKFMGWDKPIITDSGGFQVFSLGKKRLVNIAISESAVLDRERFTKKLAKSELVKTQVYPDEYRPIGELVKIDDDGVTFTSHWDGSTHRFTPERSMEIQHILGSDMMIAFDECAPYPTTHDYAKHAMDRTHVWAGRSLKAHKSVKNTSQALYGVVQGSVFEDLRTESAKFIGSMDFDGIAIGGVSVGESKKEMAGVLKWVTPLLPEDKPRHLLGVGEVDDIFTLVAHGIDTFDCVQPTRLARMGKLYGRHSEVDIEKARYATDFRPIEKGCSCYTCTNFTRAYLHHLFHVKELLAYRLATIHNLYFIHRLVNDIRQSIVDNSFLELKRSWL